MPPSRTLTAFDAARWLTALADIQSALKLAEDISGIAHPEWLQVWRAKCAAAGMHADLLRLTCADVAVEAVAA